ncbi:MAG: ActS/PrrB/RegB family redox-sensitive histidine kinase, partial [Pseudomonadota bacterium]
MTTQPTTALLPPETAAPHVRLGTLVNLRWLAILGQTVTVVTAALTLTLSFQLSLCLLTIGAAVVANLVATTLLPPTHRLTETSAFFFILFDLVQLTILLFLTGGLNNPFALLFLAPVTISATTLTLRSTAILAAIALAAISLLAAYHMPLTLGDGEPLAMHPLHLAGFWVAIAVGTLFLSGFAYRLTEETEGMSHALLATQTALAREQKLHDLGGVVAAAAHELGTPLATIKLVSTELAEELGERPELRQDAELIREQADRCRDILRSMGRAGKSDRHLRTAPLPALIREAAEPHAERGILIDYDFAPEAGAEERAPLVRRSPEVIHGLRNLIQNAVDYADSHAWVDVRWSQSTVTIRVIDDGPGYPPEMLSRLGDPFLRGGPRDPHRPGYDGMGLGLFISKTLLERTGGTMSFANGEPPGRRIRKTRSGAIAQVSWPLAVIAAEAGTLLG